MWGPLTRLGLVVAAISAAIDQASKLWLLYVFDLPARAPVRLTPFLDLVMTWNKGISYGLFQQEGPLGQWVLLAIKVAAVALLMVWLARAGSRLLPGRGGRLHPEREPAGGGDERNGRRGIPRLALVPGPARVHRQPPGGP